jgi:hypothetical protein
MEDLAMSKTNAQLAAENKALKERAEKAEAAAEAALNRPLRARYPGGLWPNQNRRTERDPAWTSFPIRMIVPPQKQAGDPLWVDVSQWVYDPETSPAKYKKTPPDMTLSISPCTPNVELEEEAKHQEYQNRARQ